MINHNPLLDIDFLGKLDNHRNRITYVRITSLTLDSYPIEQIEGVATGGSITIDGDSAVRRICNLTMSTKNLNINRIYWGITTQVQIEIGLENNIIGWYNPGISTIDYKTYYGDIIWFPMGVYLLTDFKTSSQVNNYTITLSGKDKMCRLNGDIGGEFNAETDLGVEEVWNFETKKFDKVHRPIHYIIREMVHHYAQESYGNIDIKDIQYGVEILTNKTGKNIFVIKKKNDEYNVELVPDGETPKDTYYYVNTGKTVDFTTLSDNKDFVFKYIVDEDGDTFTANDSHLWTVIRKQNDEENIEYTVRKITDGEDICYRMKDLIYPEDLIAAPGDTVTSILDKIIKTFSNYEYFYNAYGKFIFQEKQTYVNTAWNGIIKEDRENYIDPSQVRNKVKYSFEGNKIVSAYQNTPKIGDIKNDYTVWGKKKTTSGAETPIHMRYAIDKKPDVYIAFQKEDFSNEETNFSKRKVYMTQEYYDAVIGDKNSLIYNESFKNKKQPPDFLLNAVYYDSNYINEYYKTKSLNNIPIIEYSHDQLNEMWWTVLDWGQYYLKLTGEVPSRLLGEYGTIPCFSKINFPHEEQLLVNKLIFDLDKDTLDPYYGKASMGRYETSRWSPFQHGFKGCYHSLNQFITLNTEYNIESWIFCPQVPKDIMNQYASTTDIFDDYEIYIVDWREIIYQMALDYYNYNHEDAFSIKLYQNNKEKRLQLDQFFNGHTGYEQYYHDIQGFWRNLYIPSELKEDYFNGYRKIIGVPHSTISSNFKFSQDSSGKWIYQFLGDNDEITNTDTDSKEFIFMSKNNEKGYYCEETNEFFALKDLIAKDKVLDDILTLQDEKTQEIEILSEQIRVIKQGTSTTITKLVEGTELKDKNSFYFSTKDNKLFSTINTNYISNPLLVKSANSVQENPQLEYFETQNNMLFNIKQNIHTDKNELIETIISYNDELIAQLTQQLQQLQSEEAYYNKIYAAGKKAIAPYTFYYNCEKNEEDFYDDIVFSTSGFPSYIDFNAEQKKRYNNWSKLVLDSPSSLIFWFDFFDSASIGLGEFSVPAIGDRPKTVNNDSIRALIYQDVPDILLVYEENEDDINNFELNGNYQYLILPTPEDYEGDGEESDEDKLKRLGFFRYMLETGKIITSSRSVTAQEEIDNLLYNNGYCNENITITCVPIYYLEPNTIISAEDEQRIVNGYYILNKMTIPLTYNGTMQNTATKVPERVY